MSLELTLLIWSPVQLALYLGLQAILYRMEYGLKFGTGPRDDEPPARNSYLQRSDKALRNFLETYGAYVALSVAIEFSHRADNLTHWGAALWFMARIVYLPLYLLGLPYLRSLVWLVSALGLALMFFGVAF